MTITAIGVPPMTAADSTSQATASGPGIWRLDQRVRVASETRSTRGERNRVSVHPFIPAVRTRRSCNSIEMVRHSIRACFRVGVYFLTCHLRLARFSLVRVSSSLSYNHPYTNSIHPLPFVTFLRFFCMGGEPRATTALHQTRTRYPQDLIHFPLTIARILVGRTHLFSPGIFYSLF